jgi:tRNA (cytidine/uridine-2'-O-)-methyltransferase
LCRNLRDRDDTLRLALYEPDIPQNAGALMRLASCLGIPLDLIEPCGFLLDDRRLRRAGMDYLEGLELTRYASWTRFMADRNPGRLLLLTTKAATPYATFGFQHGDTLLLGRESAGVPEHVHDAADARLVVPMVEGRRSLNVALAAAMVLGEALRQIDAFPHHQPANMPR